MSERVLYRFTRDLRLTDHAGLAAAAQLGEIVPVLTIDANLVSRLSASPKRAAFFCRAVAALATELDRRGVALVVRRGPAFRSLRQLALATGARNVAWAASFDGRGIAADRGLQSALEEAQLRITIVPDAPAISPDDIAAARSIGEGYRAFTPYFEAWNAAALSRYEEPIAFAGVEIPSEPLPEPSEFSRETASVPPVSEDGAKERLRRYLDGPALAYGVARNVPSAGATSGLGPHLSFGIISARVVVEAVRARIASTFLLTEERASLRAFLQSLSLIHI